MSLGVSADLGKQANSVTVSDDVRLLFSLLGANFTCEFRPCAFADELCGTLLLVSHSFYAKT